jgi:hypothetical protein
VQRKGVRVTVVAEIERNYRYYAASQGQWVDGYIEWNDRESKTIVHVYCFFIVWPDLGKRPGATSGKIQGSDGSKRAGATYTYNEVQER